MDSLEQIIRAGGGSHEGYDPPPLSSSHHYQLHTTYATQSLPAEFSDLFQLGFPPQLWQSSLVFGIPLLAYCILALYGLSSMGFSLYIRVWIHTFRHRFFVSKVRVLKCFIRSSTY